MLPSDFAGAKDGKWHGMLQNLGFRIVPKGVIVTEFKELGESASIDTDIEKVEEEYSKNPTMRATLIMARLGQGKYRKELLELWNNQCALTGCAVLPVLRASHAKPWRESDDDERLDPNNGLPLVANLDALFDSGLIGFDEHGDMHISKNLQDNELLNGVPRTLRKPPTLEQAYYLTEHLNSVFQENEFDF
nr:HNH endonuclease signature motif containing protein [Duganella guangzhouensis]